MRAFYLNYVDSEILAPTAREIGWTHNYIIFEKCKDPNERLFYIHQTKNNGWSKNVLIHQIDNQSYQKTLISQHNFEQHLPEHLHDQAILAVKDDYAFGFLELGDKHSEYQLEQAILNNIRQFLIEMGGDFCFIANQFYLELNGKDYKVDLLLYHRGLSSLVAIDLKLGKFAPADLGQMEFYLRWLKKHEMRPGEQEPLGLILCAAKSDERVELFELESRGIRVAEYFTELPPRDLLEKKLHNAVRLARERVGGKAEPAELPASEPRKQ